MKFSTVCGTVWYDFTILSHNSSIAIVHYNTTRNEEPTDVFLLFYYQLNTLNQMVVDGEELTEVQEHVTSCPQLQK